MSLEYSGCFTQKAHQRHQSPCWDAGLRSFAIAISCPSDAVLRTRPSSHPTGRVSNPMLVAVEHLEPSN
jgi:hypothetical protein